MPAHLAPPPAPAPPPQIELLQDEGLLWTQHGLRSLAPTCSIYKKWVACGG